LILSASGFSGRREERFHFAPLSPQSLFPIHSCPSEIGGEGGDARAAEVTRRSSSGESTRCFSPTVFDVQHHAEGRRGGEPACCPTTRRVYMRWTGPACRTTTRLKRVETREKDQNCSLYWSMGYILVSSCRTTTREVMFGKRSRRTTPRRDKATRGGAGSLLFHTRSRGVSASGQVRMKERLRPSARWFLQHHSTGWNRSNLFHASLRMTCSSPFHYPRCWFCSAYFSLGFPD